MVAMTTSNLPNRRDSGFAKVTKQNSAAVAVYFNARSTTLYITALLVPKNHPENISEGRKITSILYIFPAKSCYVEVKLLIRYFRQKLNFSVFWKKNCGIPQTPGKKLMSGI